MNILKLPCLLSILLSVLLLSCSGPKVVIQYQGTLPFPPANSVTEKSDDANNPNDPDDVTTVILFSIPEPEGGNRALKKKITYPNEAIENGIEGRVSVQFIINENGTTSDFEVIEGIGYGCDEAVISAIRNTDFEFSSQDKARFIWLVTADFKL